MNKAEQAIIDSGLFTAVELEATVERTGVQIYVNKSRGAVAKVGKEWKIDGAIMFFDRGGDRFYCGGVYDYNELTNYVLPVMRDAIAWGMWFAMSDSDCDFTIAIDYVGRREHKKW